VSKQVTNDSYGFKCQVEKFQSTPGVYILCVCHSASFAVPHKVGKFFIYITLLTFFVGKFRFYFRLKIYFTFQIIEFYRK